MDATAIGLSRKSSPSPEIGVRVGLTMKRSGMQRIKDLQCFAGLWLAEAHERPWNVLIAISPMASCWAAPSETSLAVSSRA
jgi:hypothetical protein